LAITTSFQREGMVIVDMAAKISSDVRVVTLDTGRLPAETYDMIEAVRGRYGIRVEIVSPDAAEIETMVTRHGPNLFYESVTFRSLCCHFRKVRPLERKLQEFDAWVVGLRRQQSDTRTDLERLQDVGGRLKISPLADWTAEQVRSYIAEHQVPEHPLYFKGYPSIGCDPCTRATEAGETERAGRWWWEQGSNKECGLHFTADGRVERTVDVLVREILEAQHA
jgi:phosphoadenosine phosphosulfate reductase